MKNSRRTFFKQGLAGALALGSASLPVSAAAMTDGVGKAKAKRVVLISLDGICVEGFLKARTPNLDALLADGSLSLDTRVVMPSVTLPNWTSHLTGSGPELLTTVGKYPNSSCLPSIRTVMVIIHRYLKSLRMQFRR